MLKARDIDDILRNRGFEKGVAHILHELAEAQSALNVSQSELASAFMTLTDAVSTVAGGYTMLRQQTERIQRGIMFEQEFDGDKKKGE